MSTPAIESFCKANGKNLSAMKKINVNSVEKRANAAMKSVAIAQQANNKSELED